MDIFEFADFFGIDNEDIMLLTDAYEEEELGFILDCEEDDYA